MSHGLQAHINGLRSELKDQTIYVALSGGIDSMVLLHLLHNADLKPHALHCNFKLRQSDSDLDEDFVRQYCNNHNIPFDSIAFNTSEIAKKNGETIQVAARNLRYEWFNTFLCKNEHSLVLTGHHANDTIETFFINLLRGTSITGLTGIQTKRNQIFRPLLNFKKSEIIQYAETFKVPFREDGSNKDTKYIRNQVRLALIPLMETMTGNLDSKLLSLQADLADIDQYLTTNATKISKKIVHSTTIEDTMPIEELLLLEKPILLKLFKPYNLQRNQLPEILKLLNSKVGSLFKNETHVFLKDRVFLIIRKIKQHAPIEVSISEIPTKILLGGQTFAFSKVTNQNITYKTNTAFIDDSKISQPLILTNKHQGKRIKPLGMTGSKLISDILTEAKLNRFQKDTQLILMHGNDVVWIAGQTIHQQYVISDQTKAILKVEILE